MASSHHNNQHNPALPGEVQHHRGGGGGDWSEPVVPPSPALWCVDLWISAISDHLKLLARPRPHPDLACPAVKTSPAYCINYSNIKHTLTLLHQIKHNKGLRVLCSESTVAQQIQYSVCHVYIFYVKGSKALLIIADQLTNITECKLQLLNYS